MGNLIIARNNEISSAGGGNKTDISSAVVTLASSSFVYDGTLKTQTVSSVVLGGATLTAGTDYVVFNNQRTNAGTYRLLIFGRGDYDGYVGVDWSITKAQGSISASPSSLTVIGGVGTTATSTLMVVGDGEISVQSSDDSVATASVSGATVTITSVADGSAIITIMMAEGNNYLGASTTISATITIIGALDTCTPAKIQAVAQAGTGANYWSVGDKTEEISIGAVGNMTATSACAFIIGFNHNSEVEGTGIHFQFAKTISGTDIAFIDDGYSGAKTSGTWFNMNNSKSNSGGWSSSNMRSTICPAFKSALSSAWQSVIKGCKKWTDNTGNRNSVSSSVTETTDDIFLLSEKEVFGTINQANSYESSKQIQYDYYANGNSKQKYRHNSDSAYCVWWLRSPRSSDTGSFVNSNTSGNVSQSNANYSYGFAPGFMIG